MIIEMKDFNDIIKLDILETPRKRNIFETPTRRNIYETLRRKNFLGQEEENNVLHVGASLYGLSVWRPLRMGASLNI